MLLSLIISMLMQPKTRALADLPKYEVFKATSPIAIDGKADEPAWSRAAWTDDFIDIEGADKPRPRFRSRAKMLWDESNLYIFAELEEPHVWATLTKRNSIIYHDNDFEVFIDPDGDRLDYYELEVNALNTMMELHLDRPYIDGGKYSFVKSANVRSAAHVDGTLNDPRDLDRGWSVEIAIPFADLGKIAKGVRVPSPRPGDEWRLNFSRVQWMHRIVDGKYEVVPKSERDEDNWVWSTTGVIDMHRPERWGRLMFAR